MISKKYGLKDDEWFPKLPSRGRVSCVWKDIFSIGQSGSNMDDVIISGFNIKVNDGTNTKFWEQAWIGEIPLKDQFPRLYRISLQKEAMIAQTLGNLQFRRPLREWEMQELTMLNDLLESVQLHDSNPDCLQWKWSKDCKFSVKSVYSKWEDHLFSENKILNSLWKNICPPKVELFSWLAIQNGIATKSILVRRGILAQDLDSCPLCSVTAETSNHLFLHCEFAWQVWSGVMKWWVMEWVCPSNLENLWCFWNSQKFKKFEKSCWIACFFAVMWSIWTGRNELVFNNKPWDEMLCMDLVKTRMAIWIKAKYNIKEYSVEDFKRSLEGIRSLNF